MREDPGIQAAATVSAALLDEVRARYAVGPRFAAAYLDYWCRSRGHAPASLAEVLALPQPEPMWFDFALSTNVRAREFQRAFAPHLGHAGGRYLDVGCGFGGYLVAFAEQGFEVRGIELDPQRVAFSRENCADAGLEGCVHPLSVLEDDLPARLGRFDVVTCIDVIEHVLDVPRTLRNLAALLAPGGVLLLEIPNKDSLGFVRSDGHFSLFGITQLPREDAIEYHRCHFSFDYDVGEYFPLSEYVGRLEAEGLACQLVPSPFHAPRSFGRELARLPGDWLRHRRGKARALPPALRREVDRRVARYAASASWNALAARLRLRERAPVEARFLCDFWTLVARRPPAPRAAAAQPPPSARS